MDNRIKDSKLDADLKTIKEMEADSVKYDNEYENDFDMDIQNFELHTYQDTLPKINHKKNFDWNYSPFVGKIYPQNLLGSKTYTSPASFDSSSMNSWPFRNDIKGNKNLRNAMRKLTNRNSNSIITKIRSEQQSEKFILLRNVVGNITDPQKRKILLDFLDQSTLKTEYVTILESSSSCEEVKRIGKMNKIHKRRRKSPLSVLPKTNLSRNTRFVNARSKERRRFSHVNPSLKTVAEPEQQMHNFVIERKNVSDEFDSKTGEQWHTEESKEVPLDPILNQLQNYRNPFYQQRSRAQSGYSASHDEPTHPGEKEVEVNLNYDIELGFDLENYKPRQNKDIIILPNDLLDKVNDSAQTVIMKGLRKFIKKFRYIIYALLVIAIIGLVARNVYLEVKLKSYPGQIYSLDKEINELHKYNSELEVKYDQWTLDNSLSLPESNPNAPTGGSGDPSIFAKASP